MTVQNTPFDAKSRALALGMPEHIWDQFATPEDMGALQFGDVALVYLDLPKIHPPTPDKQYIRAFHPAVLDYYTRIYPGMTRAGYYFTGDPDIPPFVVDDANKFMLYANHWLGLQNEDIKDFADKNAHHLVPKEPREPKAHNVVTKEPRAASPERLAALEAKQRKSAAYADWLAACAAYRQELADLQSKYNEARDYAETCRLAVRALEAQGAPKREQ